MWTFFSTKSCIPMLRSCFRSYEWRTVAQAALPSILKPSVVDAPKTVKKIEKMEKYPYKQDFKKLAVHLGRTLLMQ